ncbi:MAG: translocation/assembly module TamB domain-containing protein [Bacillota bacterium]|nr:translocation/assembly module TamB domain-containing protein [Bacillota bacterium]
MLAGGVWHFNELKVFRRGAVAVASGEVSPEGELALAVDLRQVDLAELWPLLPEEWRGRAGAGEVRGRLRFHGRVEGSLADPAVSGWFGVAEAAWRDRTFERAEGYLRWQRPRLELEQVAILHGSSAYRLEGELLFEAAGPVARLTGEVERGEIADLLRLAGVSWDLKGEAYGQVALHGPLSAPALEGKVSVAKGRVAGQDFRRAEIQFKGRGREILLDSFTIESPLGSGYGSGTIQGEELAIDLRIEQVQLAAFPQLAASLGRAAGTVEFTGRLSGTLKDPHLGGEVKAQSLVLGPYLLDRAAGPVEYRGGRLYLTGLRLQRGQEEYTLNGELALQPDPAFEVKVEFRRARLSELLKIADQRPPAGVEALCDGTAWLTGRASHPRVRVNLLAAEGRRGEGDLTAALAMEMEGERVSLERFLVVQKGGGSLSARGTWSTAGALDLSVAAESFAVESVLRMWDPAFPLEGKLSGQARITGSAVSPCLEGSFDLEDGRMGEVPFQRAEGTVRLAEGAVELEGLQVAADGQLLQVEGRIPLPPALAERLSVAAGAAATPVDLTVSLPRGSLKILNLAWGRQAIQEGRGALNLRLIGPWDEVGVYGAFQFEQLSLSAPPFTVAEGEGRLLFRGHQVVIERASAQVNEGTAAGRGILTLRGLAVQEVDLYLQAEDLHYSDSFLDGLIDADLSLRGPANLPLLQGRVQLARTTLNLGGHLGGGHSPLDAALDVELTNADDVRIVGGESVDVRAYGRLKIGGTLREPTLAGRAEATRGVIVYLGTVFRVSEGSAVFTSLHGINPQLEVKAQARAEDALIGLRISGQVPELDLQLSSDPPLSEEEILERLALTGRISRLLRGGEAGEVTGQEMLSLLDEEIRGTVFKGLEHAVRDVLQLDEFRLERGFAEEQVQMQFGKYLVDDLYVTYSRSLNLEKPDESLRFEYRLKPGVVFTSGFDSRGEVWLGLEGKLRF